jgi:putative drug exporter of the RND superfamily
MYRRLGQTVTRFPIFTIGAWIAVVVLVIASSPETIGIWQEGELAFLPEESVSSQANRLFREAFPPTDGARFGDESVGSSVQRDPLGSNVVVVLYRVNRPEGLSDQDLDFIRQQLVPGLEEIRDSSPLGYQADTDTNFSEIPALDRVGTTISTPDDKRIGSLLTSPDEKATLIVLELKTEFLDRQNGLIVDRVENFLKSPELLRSKPIGLALAISGSATVGRDILRAESDSAKRTELMTKFLVITLLLLIYRAPLLALVPLITVGLSVEFTLALLTHLANQGVIGLFNGLEIYVTVVVYGAGVDYCLFLIARYKEELDEGRSFSEAISRSVHKVGAALATSAGTSIFGIGMMAFAEFGKFRQAGIAISIGLFVAVCFSVTFTPAMLLLLKNIAFWPNIPSEKPKGDDGWLPVATVWKKISEQKWLESFWSLTANLLRKFPGAIFLGTVLMMLPLAIYGFVKQSDLSYGLLTDLPQDVTSVEGAKAIKEHYPEGITGPTTILIQFDHDVLTQKYEGDDLADASTSERLSKEMTASIEDSLKRFNNLEFRVVDIRNQTYPLGMNEKPQQYLDSLTKVAQRVAKRNFQRKTYNSTQGPLSGQVMRIDFVFNTDPFDRISINKLQKIEEIVKASIPDDLQDSAQLFTLGPTSGIRDLKQSTDRDRFKIDVLVIIAVYLMLVALLRHPSICAYLILTVVFSYLVSLGMTFVVFTLRDPENFTGIDWKVPIYLFTILIAMGEDYNILLMSRVFEEQKKNGPVDGILIALKKTGGIISSCGLIMAGTFATLMSGTLLGMVQLGFALAFGVFLDTFVVRPILVPAYLILLHSGRFGKLGEFMGAGSAPASSQIDTSEPQQ